MKIMAETTEISTKNLDIALGLPEDEPKIVHDVMHGTQTLKTPSGVEVE